MVCWGVATDATLPTMHDPGGPVLSAVELDSHSRPRPMWDELMPLGSGHLVPLAVPAARAAVDYSSGLQATQHHTWVQPVAVPNAEVDAMSAHSTSVNLGLRADSVAQADYDMASAVSRAVANAHLTARPPEGRWLDDGTWTGPPLERVGNDVTCIEPSRNRDGSSRGWGLFANRSIAPMELVASFGYVGSK
jgi:hypothetical protein